ncbi:acyltransferase family protein [Salmonella enterica]
MRSNVVDYYRALAVTLVTIYHIHMGLGRGAYELAYGFDLYAPLGNGWVGVGIFFIISGYCMGMSSARDFNEGVTLTKSLRYFLKRFLRLAPAYYISIFVWYILINHFAITKKTTEIYDIVTHVLFIHNLISNTIYTVNGVYWSIGVEMQFYILLPVIIAYVTSLSKRILFFFICVMSTFLIYFSDLSHPWKIGLANYLALFVFGWLLYEYRFSVYAFLSRFKLGAASLIAALTMMFYKGHGYNNSEKIFEMLVSMLFGLSMNYFLFNRLKNESNGTNVFKEIAALIGRASYSIYLYNYIFYAVKPVQYNLIAGIILLIATMSFGILMYLLIEVHSEKIRKMIFSGKGKKGATPSAFWVRKTDTCKDSSSSNL